MGSAIAVEVSKNAKVGLAAATYASQGSCPTSCPLRKSGCYAETGHVGITTARLAKDGASALQVAQDEADAIDGLASGLPLRLHVVGDCASDAAAEMVTQAAARYSKRHRGQTVWTYTHAWRDVSRTSWHSAVAVLASCESMADVPKARERGYVACAVVVAKHDGPKAYNVEGVGKVIPCPNQTRGVQCVECRLCWDSSVPRVIAFEAHGAAKKKALTVIQ